MATSRGHTVPGVQATEQAAGTLKRWAEDAAGGPARFQIIFVLSCVLALDAADKASISAITGSIKSVFGVGNTEIGLLIAVVSFIGAIGTLPSGVLLDRTRRRRILIWAVIIWSIAEAVSGIATSYLFLLFTRLALGAVVAAAFPAVASLTGDYFPARDRARIYGLILAGELVGTGIGFFIAGELSSWFSWRVPLFVIALLGALVAWIVWRFLPEPARGGQSWIDEGQEEIETAEDAAAQPAAQGTAQGTEPSAEAAKAQQTVMRQGVQPREELVLKDDPTDRSLWWAMRYVLRIPTYGLLILSSALGYFFFSGVRAFGMIFTTGHFDVSRSTMS
ncbi:MAG: MFS transporter, partial [Acetobacteraceae bacterium]